MRTEEEQQAAAREREERERRDARRKSLANRRVSFAAEATLHTFHEIEYMQDSTTSTDSSRRASSVADKSPGNGDQGSTLQNPTQNTLSSASDQAELPKKPRRSSGAQSLNFHDPEDHTITSSVYSSDSEPADAVEEIAADEDEESSSDSDDGTMMSMDTMTGTSIASGHSYASKMNHPQSTKHSGLPPTQQATKTKSETIRMMARR